MNSKNSSSTPTPFLLAFLPIGICLIFFYYHPKVFESNVQISIESWSEERGSQLLTELSGVHGRSYALAIFPTQNIFGIDNPLNLRQSGKAGRISLPSFGNFHTG